jgi:hypothetical protein
MKHAAYVEFLLRHGVALDIARAEQALGYDREANRYIDCIGGCPNLNARSGFFRQSSKAQAAGGCCSRCTWITREALSYRVRMRPKWATGDDGVLRPGTGPIRTATLHRA